MKLILVGGFLGSGKTTAIAGACQVLMRQNKSVAVITNDQGDQQVDSAFVKNLCIPTREVANGCFCCNYNQLDTNLLSLREKDQPDIIFAESVGSCTDLIATLVKPLNKLRPEIKTVTSVFADACLLASLLEGRSSFLEESVRYIYKKQLEEADVLVINKTDLLTPKQLSAVGEAIQSEYQGKTILHQRSLVEEDILGWLQALEQFTEFAKHESLKLDYSVYGEGESKLAWMDKSLTIHTPRRDAVFITCKIIGSVFDQLQAHHFTIGHLKFYVERDNWKRKISFTTTSSSGDIKIREQESNCIKILINARVQTEPRVLAMLIDAVLASAERAYSCTIVTEKWSAFKPGYPQPTHRFE